MANNRPITDITLKTKRPIIESPHFWALIVLTLSIVFIYQAWPWREWDFIQDIWKWFPWLSSLDYLAIFEMRYDFYGILFILPIVYAAIIYKWLGALILAVLSIIYSALATGSLFTFDPVITSAALLLSPVAITVAITIEMELRDRDRRIMAEREKQRKIYLSKMYEVQENERRRLAQELHDDTIQTFLVIAKQTQKLLSSNRNTGEVEKRAESIRDTALQAVEDVRRICLDLRPSILDDLGLVPALRWLVDRLNIESGISTQITVDYTDGKKSKLSPHAEVTMFRIAQEILNNIKDHSQAKEASIKLEFGNESLKMTIRDDGKGFIKPRKLANLLTEGKLGLIGIQERVESLGGNLKISSKPAEGTLLSINVPY